MRIRDYCDGMICNWGAHTQRHCPVGNDTDRTGPVEVEATGAFHKGVLWNVLGSFKARYRYANGVELFYEMAIPTCASKATRAGSRWSPKTRAYTPESGVLGQFGKILKSVIGPGETRLLKQSEKTNFIDCVVSRERTMEDAEVGHRTNSICHLAHIRSPARRVPLKMGPRRERFDNEAANKLLSRPFYRDGWDPEKVIGW
jgi:hypothetical protein